MSMFKRKLLALNHSSPDSFNADEDESFMNLVLWLEDQKIRHYKIEDRGGIRSQSYDQWSVAFQKYLQDLGCPHNTNDRHCVVDWLLGYAVRLEYGDNVEKYGIKQNETSQQAPAANPLENMNCDTFLAVESAEFKAGVASLATLLSIPPHHDHGEVCKAICTLISERLSKEALQKSTQDEIQKEVTALSDLELGFDAGDYISNDAAKILRLLHIRNLRDVQTKVNEAIVAVQAITADPKTDQRLGKVGR